ncbi:hypothetical protein GGC64_005934 [Mycobacterium sp. OAS707]|nr:hypothetical protein [Mycobacterium sp. OAS707]
MPLITSPTIGDDIIWAIPGNRVVVAMRSDTSVTTDTSASFSSDRTAVRGIIRVSWGFTDPAAIAKIATTP